MSRVASFRNPTVNPLSRLGLRWSGVILAVTLIAATVAPCAQAQETRQRISLPGWRQPFPIEDIVVDFTIDAPRPAAFAAVIAVFDDMKIPTAIRDSVTGMIGTMNSQPLNFFAGRRLSQVLDCGYGSTGPNADSYKLTVVFLALLDASGPSRTKLRIGFVAAGKEPVGQNILQCGSTGRLEEAFSAAVSKRLANPRAP